MPNYALLVEYDGSYFHGWQIQKSQRSVQGTLEEALLQILVGNTSSPLSVAGRTDTGVHALGMVCNFRTPRPVSFWERLPKAINAKVRQGVAVKGIVEVPEEFHSRFSCQSRLYTYRVYYNSEPSPLEANRAYWMRYPVDWERIRKEMKSILGERDFRSFGKKASAAGKRTFRNLQSISLEERDPNLYLFQIQADGFLHNMVRILVGTLLDIGKGRWDSRTMDSILSEEDRVEAGRTLPPHGLYFQRAFYPSYPQIDFLYNPRLPVPRKP